MNGDGFCFGAISANTLLETFGGNGEALADLGWTPTDDSPIAGEGWWTTYNAEASLRAQIGEAGFASGQGWALYQGSNAWGNYIEAGGGDNAMTGSYLMFTGNDNVPPVTDTFIMEADIYSHDNDGKPQKSALCFIFTLGFG